MSEGGGSRPLELILARNLLASLSTAAFLIDFSGEVAFYNDAAGNLLGRRYEDAGPMSDTEWSSTYGPFDDDGEPIPFRELELTRRLRANHPAHDRFCIRSAQGGMHEIEASALPIVGTGGYHGAIVVFWPAGEQLA